MFTESWISNSISLEFCHDAYLLRFEDNDMNILRGDRQKKCLQGE